MRIGLLHPGEMGAALAAQIDGEVLWANEGRSEVTAARAEEAGLIDEGSLEDLVAAVDVILSVCPPAAAREVARSVAALGLEGVYVDANGVAPATVREIALHFEHFVDGKSLDRRRLRMSSAGSICRARPLP